MVAGVGEGALGDARVVLPREGHDGGSRCGGAAAAAAVACGRAFSVISAEFILSTQNTYE
ncbi:hypothetical protein E2562_017938 [Oryza meyeriana var. granulata]|uniref:Uncharacterized protein n=1 Tax=Oryza meyeriana var. granulata TaxID=110450 RepID=A0A6G1CR08_9ORYZ|nr:hypothetical protein E2562_017938 [Oryza meyeriana var. granulata]